MKTVTPTWVEIDGEPPSQPLRACHHPGCPGEGEHRAPRSPNELDCYYWFCLEHVRDYNAKWDFFTGMSQTEIYAFRADDVTWHRPTWPTAVRKGFERLLGGKGASDLFGLLGADDSRNGADGGMFASSNGSLPAAVRDALAVMNLARTATLGEIKSRFKELVKRHHPDLNGGDKHAEERLKDVIEAYRTLSRHGSA